MQTFLDASLQGPYSSTTDLHHLRHFLLGSLLFEAQPYERSGLTVEPRQEAPSRDLQLLIQQVLLQIFEFVVLGVVGVLAKLQALTNPGSIDHQVASDREQIGSIGPNPIVPGPSGGGERSAKRLL